MGAVAVIAIISTVGNIIVAIPIAIEVTVTITI
jgi:hypothetical protein